MSCVVVLCVGQLADKRAIIAVQAQLHRMTDRHTEYLHVAPMRPYRPPCGVWFAIATYSEAQLFEYGTSIAHSAQAFSATLRARSGSLAHFRQ